MRLFGLIAVTVLIAASAGNDAAKKDLEKFQGNWQLISMERDGKKTPPEDAKKITLTIQGDKFILRKDAVTISEGTMKLDATKKPKQINETLTTGPNKGKIFSAIYEVDDEQHQHLLRRRWQGPTHVVFLRGRERSDSSGVEAGEEVSIDLEPFLFGEPTWTRSIWVRNSRCSMNHGSRRSWAS